MLVIKLLVYRSGFQIKPNNKRNYGKQQESNAKTTNSAITALKFEEVTGFRTQNSGYLSFFLLILILLALVLLFF